MKKYLLGFSLSIILLTSVGCSQNEITTPSQSTSDTELASTQKAEDITINIVIIEDKKEITSKELVVSSDQSVLDILKDHFDVKEDKGFVTEIDGKSQDTKAQKYWMYYMNDEEASKGANDTFPSNKDKIEWRLNEFK